MQLFNNLLFILSCILFFISLLCIYIVCIGIYGVLLVCFVFRKQILDRLNTVCKSIIRYIKTKIIG